MAKIQGYITTRAYPALQTPTQPFSLLVDVARDKSMSLSQKATTAKITQRYVPNLTQQARTYFIPNYYGDLYRKVRVIPHSIELGAIASEQVITVQVWNANRHAIQLTSSTISQNEGIVLIGPLLPHKQQGLAISQWKIKVGMMGPPVIDSRIIWHILGDAPVMLSLMGSRSTDWQFFPNWAQDVVENLAFLTVVHQSYSGAEQRIARRLSPRRTFEFQVLVEGKEKQMFDQAIYAYGSRVWAMPIFTDEANCLAEVAQGAMALPTKTLGRDFSVGGQALLIDETGQRETVEILAIEPTQLLLKRAVLRHYGIGARIYPVRSAVLTDPPSIRRISDSVISAQVRFSLIEHNAFSDDISHLPQYRGVPVLELSSDWSEDITGDYQRLIAELDNQTGIRYRLDTAQIAFQVIRHQFILYGRDEQRLFRQLCYYLKGRQKPIWVSTSSSDFYVVDDIRGSAMDVAYTGYSSMLFQQTGRRDLRIECVDGTLYYRRILSADVVNQHTERLMLDGEPLSVKQEEIIKVSFITLSRLESDTISWEHKTDAEGVAMVSMNFRSVRDDLEGV
ncbi:phage tail protein [Pasteurella multocida]|uniref:phage tail protein n=1 Tax=Pasteurella multocida TaxID=747 RepID=UPI00292EF851|nr:phage tail protein [Pasteurella multocida]WNY75977.1 phage tail protein [Pasteurella multocida]